MADPIFSKEDKGMKTKPLSGNYAKRSHMALILTAGHSCCMRFGGQFARTKEPASVWCLCAQLNDPHFLPLAGAAALPLAGAVLADPASDFLAMARTAKDLLFLLIMTLKRSKSFRLARFL